MCVCILPAALVRSLGLPSLPAAQQPAPTSGPTKQLEPADLKAWKTIRSSVLSNDGKWFAYVLAPNEGDANVIIRSTAADNKEFTFPIGRSVPPVARGGRRRRRGTGWRRATLDQRRLALVAFTVYPPTASGRGGRAAVRVVARGGGGGGAQTTDGTAQTPAPQNKLAGQSRDRREERKFDRVRRYAFNGDKPTWLAVQA
jgi:hypothetical protein